ncbi:F-box/kelch-repeat protein [Quillaja saponaria]|uniref:F-box/kelch-repeat protein n=1 Tax=Quillaja saponaria TaxID=32244 RepID=A0AAD7KQ92_QUISA|nr:F-box/kelch-repeat protein [Quillaja saponaria]
MGQERKQIQEENEAPINGDILEAIISHVPLIDLVPASHVSKSWHRAVYSSLCYSNTIKPWLMVYTQGDIAPYVTTTHAYDPRSRVWLEFHRPSIEYVSGLGSSHSSLLYMLSPTKFAFSFDPLHLMWHHVEPPLVWRQNPVVAMIGQYVVVAGGACDFYNEPLLVEIYDMNTRKWGACESIPLILGDSLSSTWLSVAVDDQRMHVTEKNSGATYSFDPKNNIWHGPYDLHPDQSSYCYVIGSLNNNRLIMASAQGDAENVKSVKLWELRGESELTWKQLKSGEMPKEMLEKLKGESDWVPSIAMSSMGDFAYIHNPWRPEDLVVCEVVNGACKWRSERNAVVNDRSRMNQRLVVTCSNVGMEDLKRALRSEKAEVFRESFRFTGNCCHVMYCIGGHSQLY